MDFFARQEAARKHTGRLLVLFLAAVVCIIVAVHGVVSVAIPLVSGGGAVKATLTKARASQSNSQPVSGHFTNPTFVAIDSGATLFVILCGVAFTWSSLAGGGKEVAEACGGRHVEPASSDPRERRLLNVVEEMAIASGVPVPPVYVLEDEQGINAFAAGRTTSDAVVAVTRGALDRLTRDELQGVIGHEFSHILNGDMRLNLRLASWLGGIMGLAVIGEILIRLLLDSSSSRRSSSRSRDSGQIVFALFILGAGLFVIGYVGVFFARLIQAAVSRQREFLADASSVQFTRNPLGLANALKKIAGVREGSALHAPHASMVRHMFFSNAAKPSWLDFMLATHPPIEERIKWLDPAFNPALAQFTRMNRPEVQEPVADDENDEAASPGVAPLAGGLRQRPCRPPAGAPQHANLRQAAGFVGTLPEPLAAAARDPLGACAVVYALLLAEEPAMREHQLRQLREMVDAPVMDTLLRLLPLQILSDPARKLPLINFTAAGLRRMSRPQFDQFHAALDWLVASDGYLDLFEFTLQKAMCRHLDTSFGLKSVSKSQQTKLAALSAECVVLLSCLAHQGAKDDPARATKAYRGGLPLLALNDAPRDPLPQGACKLDAVAAALDKLGTATFPLKKKILAACAATVASDGEVRVGEAQLLNAISNALECPVPLDLSGVTEGNG